jgi:hypothetical protein
MTCPGCLNHETCCLCPEPPVCLCCLNYLHECACTQECSANCFGKRLEEAFGS